MKAKTLNLEQCRNCRYYPEPAEPTICEELTSNGDKMTNEKIIIEFKNDILKSTGLPDWCSLSWYNQVEQAARNLITRTEQKTASAIFADIEAKERSWYDTSCGHKVLAVKAVEFDRLKKRHLSEAKP